VKYEEEADQKAGDAISMCAGIEQDLGNTCRNIQDMLLSSQIWQESI